MMLIACPWCGPRNETEFRYGGPVTPAYPEDPSLLSDADWARYLHVNATPAGPLNERWCHAAGCRRWFTARRDTLTHEFRDRFGAGVAS